MEQVGHRALGNRDATPGELLVDLRHAAVLAVAQRADQRDDVQAELAVRVGPGALFFWAEGPMVAGAARARAAADREREALETSQRGDGPDLAIRHPERAVALPAVPLAQLEHHLARRRWPRLPACHEQTPCWLGSLGRPGIGLHHTPARFAIVVFLSVRRTVWYEIASTISSSTSLSAKSRKVQCACPSGGSPQASATRWASCSPSSLRRYVRRGARRLRAASRPSSTNWRRTRATVGWLTSSASAMASSVQPGPTGRLSAFSKMRAWVSLRAGAVPAAMRCWSWSRWESVRTTGNRLCMPSTIPVPP